MAKQSGIAARVRTLIEPAVRDAGYFLWDVLFEKEGAEDTLFVLIDRKGGVSLSDCERVTKLIDPILDEADPIPQSYMLEVSSAGSERVLRRADQFEASIGCAVTVSLYAPIDGAKEYTGTLDSYDADTIVVGGKTLEKGCCGLIKTVDTTTL